MFFPWKEYPTPALEAALAELGVVCRRLPAMRQDDAQVPPLQEVAGAQLGGLPEGW